MPAVMVAVRVAEDEAVELFRRDPEQVEIAVDDLRGEAEIEEVLVALRRPSRDSRCSDRPHSQARVERSRPGMRLTCSILTCGWVAFGMNRSKYELTTSRTESRSTSGASNGADAVSAMACLSSRLSASLAASAAPVKRSLRID